MPLDGTTLPPPQYDYLPDMPVIERVLTVTEVNRICIGIMNKEAGQGRVWWGCAKIAYYENKKACLIWRINDLRVRRHEIGHCSGWPADHPMQKIKEAAVKPTSEYIYSGPKAPISHPTIGQQLLPWPVK